MAEDLTYIADEESTATSGVARHGFLLGHGVNGTNGAYGGVETTNLEREVLREYERLRGNVGRVC